MKAKMLCEGNDGTAHISAGDECARDSEWLRRQLVNGLAEPLDDAAKALCASADSIERYRSPALIAAAREMGITSIPAV